MVTALEEETAEKVKPLPFQAALPVRPALLAAGTALVCVGALVAAAVNAPEWRTALTRVALALAPYTTLTATTSADVVDENTDVDVRATMAGRARPAVVLHVREAGEPEWRQGEAFRVAAKHVAALAAEEAAQQLAAARDLANDVALQTAPTEQKTPGAGGSGESKVPMPGLGMAAEQAKTLKDVLEKLAGSGAEGDADAARKAAGLLKSEDIAAASARLEKPGAGGDKGERQDISERFAALGQKLDQAYRDTVAPRLEAIARLEREANELEKKAAAADDSADWRKVRQPGGEFIEKLEAAGLGSLAGEDVRVGLRNASVNGGREVFGRGIAATHARLVAKLQEFVAGDRFATGNEAVPPEYRDLVERYLRALSAGSTK